MRKTAVAIFVLGALVAQSREAAAQWSDRGYLNFSTGVESSSSTLTDTRNYTLYDEPATTTTSSSITGGNILDFSGGVRVFRNLSVGAAWHMEKNRADVAITGSVPNPIFFNRPRQLTHTENELERKEMAAHLQFGWMVPFGQKFDVLVFAGPSWFRLEQEVVSQVDVVERGLPFTEVVPVVETETRKKSVVGYNVGFDASYLIWQNDRVRLGAGGFVRYTVADATVPLMTTEVESDVGGAQFGIGVRFRF
jgi:hypothetical protein